MGWGSDEAKHQALCGQRAPERSLGPLLHLLVPRYAAIPTVLPQKLVWNVETQTFLLNGREKPGERLSKGSDYAVWRRTGSPTRGTARKQGLYPNSIKSRTSERAVQAAGCPQQARRKGRRWAEGGLGKDPGGPQTPRFTRRAPRHWSSLPRGTRGSWCLALILAARQTGLARRGPQKV